MPPRRLAACLTGCLALAMYAQPAGAQVSPPGALNDPAGLTAAEARADFDVLRNALQEAHDGLYRFSTKRDMDRRFDAHRARLDGPISRLAFIALISEMLADTRDGHMRLEHDEATNAALRAARLFPFRVRLEGGRLLVLYNDTPADTVIRPGMEVVGINGRAILDILGVILPTIPGDGYIETGTRARLGSDFGRYYWLFVEQADEFTVTARDAAGRTISARVPGVRISERAADTNPVNARIRAGLSQLDGATENVSLRYMSDPDIGYLRIRSFGGEDYAASLERVFRELNDRGTKALILDLRGNGGGVDQYGALLVSHFMDRPFRYFDRIHVTTVRPSFATWKPSTFEDLRNGTVADPAGGYLVTAALHDGVAEQAPAQTPFSGQLVVLIDGGTFSTAADVSAVLHHAKRATFIGEETGGGYEGNTSGLNALITLPNSRLGLKIPMYGYWNAVSSDIRGRGVQPDHPEASSIGDLLRGLDAQLQRAVAVIRAAAATSSGPRR